MTLHVFFLKKEGERREEETLLCVPSPYNTLLHALEHDSSPLRALSSIFYRPHFTLIYHWPSTFHTFYHLLISILFSLNLFCILPRKVDLDIERPIVEEPLSYKDISIFGGFALPNREGLIASPIPILSYKDLDQTVHGHVSSDSNS